MDEQRCTVHRAPDRDTHLHACWSGFLYLSYVVFDEEIGVEVERIEVVPCRRCIEVKG